MNTLGCFLLLLLFALTNAEKVDSSEEEENINYRLSDSVVPVHYDIEITPYLFENEAKNKEQFTFDGKTKIWIEPTESNVREIELHATNLTIKNIQLTWLTNGRPKRIIMSMSAPDPKTNKLSLKLTKPLIMDEDYLLTISYSGIIQEGRQGLYRTSYENGDNETVWIAVTQFEPVHARKVFPCFDEPKFKATFVVQINRNNYYQSYSNTKLNYSIPLDKENRTIDVFKKTPLMSTYTLAMVITDFDERSETDDFGILVKHDSYAETDLAANVTLTILESLNEYTGIPYLSIDGIEKLHLVAVPKCGGGAMENWGLVTFNERTLLCEENCGDFQENMIRGIISHELAHMWFGNLVTCEWWSYAWLNEGLASYITNYGVQQLQTSDYLDVLHLEELSTLYEFDTVQEFPLTNKDVNSQEEIQRMFGPISYMKGSAIMKMFDHMLEPENFKTALRSYLKENAFKSVTPKHLMSAFKKQWTHKHINFETLFNDWTEQAGYPIVTVRVSEDRKSFRITQKQFAGTDEEKRNSTSQWIVPFTYTTNTENDFEDTSVDVYLEKRKIRQISLKEPVDWVIGNIHQIGYYRVNYDTKTWQNIGSALKEDDHDGIPVRNRAQITYDIIKFADSGLVDYNDALELLEYLESEDEILPLITTAMSLNDQFNLLRGETWTLFKKFGQDLIKRQYEKISPAEESEENDNFQSMINSGIKYIACAFGMDDCIEKSIERVEQYLNENNNNLTYDDGTAMTYAVEKYPEKYFDILFENLKDESPKYLKFLICTPKTSQQKKVLNFILNAKDSKELSQTSTMAGMLSSPCANRDFLFNFIVENFEALLESDEDPSINWLFRQLISNVVNQEQYDSLKKLIEDNEDNIKDYDDMVKDFEQATADQIKWYKEKQPQILKYLRNKYGPVEEDDDDDDDDEDSTESEENDVQEEKIKKVQVKPISEQVIPEYYKIIPHYEVKTDGKSKNISLTEIFLIMKQSILTAPKS